MELLGTYLMAVVEKGGLFAPLLFISFHILRPLFFLPVAFICISGGLLFGAVTGSILSVIGITLSSYVFYYMIQRMPKTYQRLVYMKSKIIGEHTKVTTLQVALLRLIPFVHFHLLSLCLLEISSNVKEYMRASFLSNIPLAIAYTAFGQWMSNLSPVMMVAALCVLLPCIYLIRRKEIIIKWEEFFPEKKKKERPIPSAKQSKMPGFF
ncbi:TVP38/TMEM64 family protein [Radiobacillus deserti]|uniref:TVP38/TMEM64 family membrane protein n=1 Tax=Radiobacillus deserti TaxID=2594883 RepID=A0A516KHF1_9BACI|nr:VTT domain-containing protein [Radiobacillus deserti]QDP40820.1 TVP38/TMEM64 family protein [Radiobacillus deserti]